MNARWGNTEKAPAPDLESEEFVETVAPAAETAFPPMYMCRQCGCIVTANEKAPHEVDCRVRALPTGMRWTEYKP